MSKSVQTIGIVGGNLLATMLCIEAKKRGIKTLLLEPEVNNIATDTADKHLIGPIDRENIERLALRADVVVFATAEIPIIPKEMLDKHQFVPSMRGIDLVANRVEQLTYASLAEVPAPNYYHYSNKLEFLKQLAEVKLPIKVYQMYVNGYEMMELDDATDLEAFLYEINDETTDWIIEECPEYERLLSISAIKKADKVYTYPIQEEFLEDEDAKYVMMPSAITKTMNQRLVRYTKKILQEVDTEGVFSLKFGVKRNKSVELMNINPGITVGDMTTLHGTDLSIYEQVINLIEGQPIKDGILTCACKLIAIEQGDQKNVPKFPYHQYRFDQHNERPIDIYIKKVPTENI